VRSRALPAAALVAGALLLSGCGTGLQATTYTNEKAPRDFAVASVADLEVRNLGIAPPTVGQTFTSADTATLSGSVINTGTQDDELIGVETDAAGSATLQVAGAAVPSVPVAAGTDASTWTASLSGLTGTLRVGQYISVTLVFAKAGRLADLQVPIRSGDTGLGGRPAEQDPYLVGE
jgi:copper(I)-binding protein